MCLLLFFNKKIKHVKEIALFENSPVTITEFTTLLFGLVDRLTLPDNYLEILLEFIREIVPRANHLKTSFHKIKQFKNKASAFK